MLILLFYGSLEVSGSLIESLVGMPEFWTAEYVYYMVLTAHQSRFQGEKLVLLHLIIRP